MLKDLINKIEYLNEICSYENITIDEGALKILSRAADGSVRDALSLLDQSIAYSEGNLKMAVSGSSAELITLSTIGLPTSGKWYWEVKYTSANSNTNPCVGAVKTENYEYNQNIQ